MNFVRKRYHFMINFENQSYSSIKYAENLPKVEKVNNSLFSEVHFGLKQFSNYFRLDYF